MQGKTTPQGNLLRTLKVTRLRQYALLLAVATISLCLMASDCGEDAEIEFGYSYLTRTDLPQWTPGGTQIVMKLGRGIIYIVDADGTNLRVLNSDAENRNRDAHSPSLSPDGSQVVYSQRLKTGGLIGGQLNYELVLSSLDRSDVRQLTENRSHEITPVWSPDGSRIAFLSDRYEGDEQTWSGEFHLFTMASDGSDVDDLAPQVIAEDFAPVWSPDGSHIAFLSSKRVAKGYQYVIYTVRSDGSDLREFSKSISVPTWSPNSKSIAFLMSDNEGVRIHTMGLDGSALRNIDLARFDWFGGKPSFVPFNLYWSGDGSEIRLGSYPFIVAAVDGSNIQDLSHLYPKMADIAWSPDGSRVAVNPQFRWDESASEQDSEVALFIMSPNGSDKRVLIRESGSEKYEEGKGEQWSPDYARGQ